jgi:hypothetical protein
MHPSSETPDKNDKKVRSKKIADDVKTDTIEIIDVLPGFFDAGET